MSDSNQNLETTCNSKLKFSELQDFFIKRVPKVQSKKNYVQLTQQFQNFNFSGKDITLDYGFLLRLLNTFIVDTEAFPLHDFTLCAHKSYVCILQIDSFEKYVVQCCILSDLIRRISNYICQILFTCIGPTNLQN